MTSSNKMKRDRNSMFDAVHLLDSQDAQAERKRQARSKRWTEQSLAAQSQTKIYSSLVECRILLQQSLHTEKNKDNDNDDAELVQCNQLLATLLQARQALVNRSDPETDYKSAVQEDERLSEILQSEYEPLSNSWKEVLNRRHKDVRLHAGLTAKTQYKVLDSSFWQQVEATVQHEQQQQQQLHSRSVSFDDSKVYQQMLKDFVSSASQSAGSSTAVAAQERLRSQQQSSTTKKQVDRKASKGRKIRYHEIPKLVHFTFPISRPNSGALDEDEWFQSLFGGIGKQP